MEEQKRHSGFETMRILSMVMIILMHGIGHGGLGSAAPQGSAAFWIYWLLFYSGACIHQLFCNAFRLIICRSARGLFMSAAVPHWGTGVVLLHAYLLRCGQAGAAPLSAVKLLRARCPYLQRLLVCLGLFSDVSLGAGAERGGAKP